MPRSRTSTLSGAAGGAATLSGAAAVAAALLASAPARADETSAARRAAAAHEMDRPYTMAELSAGFMTLPAADVCLKSTTDCSRGEGSVGVGLSNLYRFGSFGVGAGILWATTLRNDAAKGAEALERDHSRRYFMVETAFRYYVVRGAKWEWWGGAMLGAVIVRDAWTVKADREPYSDAAFVGPRATTIRTEGFSAGIAGGVDWSFASNWSLGASLRYSNWFLPPTAEVSPTGDIASLSGRLDMFQLAANVAYRIAL